MGDEKECYQQETRMPAVVYVCRHQYHMNCTLVASDA